MPPRPEYPRPQYCRSEWINLNGPWSFAEDPEQSGVSQGWTDALLPETIVVPFCRESALSGIARTDQMPCVWYSRELTIPSTWQGRRVLLHFGAADYETAVWIDGRPVGTPHRGGHSSFSIELTDFVRPGANHRLTLRCLDEAKLPRPCGKQRSEADSSGCVYVQTTGIWQTVWLEPLPTTFLRRPRITPLFDQGAFLVEQSLDGLTAPHNVTVRLKSGDRVLAEAAQLVDCDPLATLHLPLKAADRRPWSPEDPHLYDLEIELHDAEDKLIDRIESFAGLRSVAVRGHRVCLNGRPLFQRLVLDQGYYPEGLLTAPSDEALVRDIEIAREHGFNGARLHQKVFEERFLYHADRLGYLVWAELPDWGPEFQKDDPKTINARWIEEWLEVIERDYSHPSIVGWCPLNEQEGQNPAHLSALEIIQRALVLATKQADRTRPVLDASGWIHRCPESDIYDDHNYEQSPEKLAAVYRDRDEFRETIKGAQDNISSGGKPFFVSEFGGIRWVPEGTLAEGWGYGEAPKTETEFLERFAGLCRALLDNPRVFGYCYTQLTDVFQEINGLVTFDRRNKFEPATLAAAQSIPAAIEGLVEHT